MASAVSTTFVTDLYQTILLRSGSANDIASYATLLDSNLLTQAQEITAFETSNEAVNFVDPIARLYEAFFRRAPDATGFSTWVNDLRNGTMTLAQIAGQFALSNEFTSAYGTTPNAAAFVTALYQNVLGRSTDPTGLAYWVGQLTTVNSTTLAAVALGFSQSNEFIANSTAPINNWLSIADANAVNGVTPVYPGGVITGIVPTAPSSTIFLTTVPGTSYAGSTAVNTTFISSLTPFLTDGKGPTLLSGDTITGATGVTNTLLINDQSGAADIIPPSVNISNIQKIILATNGTAGFLDTSTLTGVLSVQSTSNGAGLDTVNSGPGTAVTIQHNNPTGGVTSLGGTTITITTVGVGTITVGANGPVTSQDPTGAVFIQSNAVGATPVNVFGGTNVTVNMTEGSNTGAVVIGRTGAVLSQVAIPSGAVIVNDAGTGAIKTFGGTTQTINGGGGAITVGDATGVAPQPSGAVTVVSAAPINYDNLAAVGHNNKAAAVTVEGGASVSVTTNAGSVTVGAQTNAAIVKSTAPVGDISITDTANDLLGKGNAAVTVTGGTTVEVSAANANVTVGAQGPAAPAGSNPTGAITVTETAATTANNDTADGLSGAPQANSTITINGGNGVTVTAQGQNVAIGLNQGTAGAQVVNQSAVLTGSGLGGNQGAVTIAAGSSATVTTTGGAVTILGATGNDTVADTFSGISATDAFTVIGGAIISLTDTYGTQGAFTVGAAPTLNALGTGLANGTSDPTGNVTIVDGSPAFWGTGAVNVVTDGGTTVSISGGAVGTILDANTILATGGAGAGHAVAASALTTVSLDGNTAGATAIVTDALASLTDIDSKAANATTVTDNTVGHALKISLGNDKALTVNDILAGSLLVTDNGKAEQVGFALTLNSAVASSLTLENTVALPLAIGGLTGLTTITADKLSTGAVTFGNVSGSGTLTLIDVSASSGADSVTLNPGLTSFKGGLGADTVTIIQNGIGGGVTLSGGTGANTLIANYVAGLTTGNFENDISLGATASIHGFQTLGLGAAAGDTTAPTLGTGVFSNGDDYYDAAGFTGLTLGAITGPVAFKNVSAGAGLTITASPGNGTAWNHTVNYLLNNNSGSNDTLPVTIGNPLAAVSASVATSKVENVTIASTGLGTNTLNIADSTDHTVTVTGSAAVNVNLYTDNTLGFVATNSSLVSSINASGSSGTVNVGGVNVQAAGATIVGGSGHLIASGVNGGNFRNDDAASVAEVDTLTFTGSFATGDVVKVTINGATTTYVTAGGPLTATQEATAVFGALATAGFAFANPSAGTVTITDSTAGVPFASSISVTSSTGLGSDGTTTAFQNNQFTAAVDTITTGAGGGLILIGQGGGWNAGIKGYDIGSETINLSGSAAAPDMLLVNGGAVAAFNTIRGGVTGFQEVASKAADSLQFQFGSGSLGGGTQSKTVLANFANLTNESVATAIGATGLTAAAVLDPTGPLVTDLANLTYTVSNGVITFGVTATHTLSAFTQSELIDAAELILDYGPTGGGNQVAAYASGGNTFVVANGNTAAITTALNTASVVELIGQGSVSGFGITGAATAIVSTDVNNLAGPAVAGTVNNDAGFSSVTLAASGASTSFTNLAPSSQITVNSGFNETSLTVTQTGSPGADSLTVNLQGNDHIGSLTVSNDAFVVLNNTGGNANSIGVVVDATNTMTTLYITGTTPFTLGAVASSSLTTIDASAATYPVTLGSAGAPISNPNLTIKAPTTDTHGTSFIYASGAADTITQAAGGTGPNNVTASGAGDTITLANGNNTITAAGLGDHITFGNGTNFVHASSSGDVVHYGTGHFYVNGAFAPNLIATGGGVTIAPNSATQLQTSSFGVFVGNGSTVTLAASNGNNENVIITGDVTGGTSASFAQTTINGAVDGTNQTITFNNLNSIGGALTESLAGTASLAGAQVNVASVSTLAQALDLAATYVSPPVSANPAPGAGIAASNGKIDWFQFGGNTYIVEAVNGSGAAADHTALGAHDAVVELTGIVNLNGGSFAGGVLHI